MGITLDDMLKAMPVIPDREVLVPALTKLATQLKFNTQVLAQVVDGLMVKISLLPEELKPDILVAVEGRHDPVAVVLATRLKINYILVKESRSSSEEIGLRFSKRAQELIPQIQKDREQPLRAVMFDLAVTEGTLACGVYLKLQEKGIRLVSAVCILECSAGQLPNPGSLVNTGR